MKHERRSRHWLDSFWFGYFISLLGAAVFSASGFDDHDKPTSWWTVAFLVVVSSLILVLSHRESSVKTGGTMPPKPDDVSAMGSEPVETPIEATSTPKPQPEEDAAWEAHKAQCKICKERP